MVIEIVMNRLVMIVLISRLFSVCGFSSRLIIIGMVIGNSEGMIILWIVEWVSMFIVLLYCGLLVFCMMLGMLWNWWCIFFIIVLVVWLIVFIVIVLNR